MSEKPLLINERRLMTDIQQALRAIHSNRPLADQKPPVDFIPYASYRSTNPITAPGGTRIIFVCPDAA